MFIFNLFGDPNLFSVAVVVFSSFHEIVQESPTVTIFCTSQKHDRKACISNKPISLRPTLKCWFF